MKQFFLRKALLFQLVAVAFLVPTAIFAQPTEANKPSAQIPLNDFTVRTNLADHRVLPYQPVREADVFWEKRIWRVIDVREKLNAPFANEALPFFDILKTEIAAGRIAAFDAGDDRFSKKLEPEQVAAMLVTRDTTEIFDVQTGLPTIVGIENTIDGSNVQRFRIEEVWFFDKNEGALKCRILGIAPLMNVVDKTTNEFRYEKPLFWVHYPSSRERLARFQVFNSANDASPMSWEDVFEMRQFASTIYKESNVQNQRLSDYLSGRDQLVEADKISQSIFNFESDLWQW